MNIKNFWYDVLRQDADAIRAYFYPNQWDGEVERMVEVGDLIISATHVYAKDHSVSFHVTSFIQLKDDKISCIDEYWGDDGDAPQWRQDMKIGGKIHDNPEA